MRWRLLAIFLGVIGLMLLAQDVPLAGHLRTVERDRLLARFERDAFILAASAEAALSQTTPDTRSLAKLYLVLSTKKKSARHFLLPHLSVSIP